MGTLKLGPKKLPINFHLNPLKVNQIMRTKHEWAWALLWLFVEHWYAHVFVKDVLFSHLCNSYSLFC